MSVPKPKKYRFPDPNLSDESGLLCFGGNLDVETLCEAYYRGIFPWPQKGCPLLWFSPPERGILDFSDFHISRRLAQTARKQYFRYTINENFEGVIRGCAEAKRKGQSETWISESMIKSYIRFHKNGFAHSIECWEEEKLVGGLYGVAVGGTFSGESMFGLKRDVSKLCVIEMVEYLKSKGLEWMDIQMVTPVLGSLGGKYISRSEFLARLETGHRAGKKLF